LEGDGEAVEAAQRSIQRNSHFTSAWRALASSLALVGRRSKIRTRGRVNQ
jgi:hypothetical protein